MKKLFLFAILGMIFASCITEQPRFVLTPPGEVDEVVEAPRAFVITDFKNKDLGLEIPEWANRFFEDGIFAVRAMETDLDTYVFIARSEGTNFNGLNLWINGFNAELNFPRLAASRVQAHFSAGVHFPDAEFGALYETVIRAVSDARWTGAAREDDFWIRRRFFADAEFPDSEDWEFLILVTIEKIHFSSQLNSIFANLRPNPPPTEAQRHAFNRVAERFFDGF